MNTGTQTVKTHQWRTIRHNRTPSLISYQNIALLVYSCQFDCNVSPPFSMPYSPVNQCFRWISLRLLTTLHSLADISLKFHTHAEMANHDESKFLRDMTIYRHARHVSRIHSLVCHLSFRGDSGDDGGEDKRKAKEAQVKRSGGRREGGGTRGRGWKGKRKGNGSKGMVVVKTKSAIKQCVVCFHLSSVMSLCVSFSLNDFRVIVSLLLLFALVIATVMLLFLSLVSLFYCFFSLTASVL